MVVLCVRAYGDRARAAPSQLAKRSAAAFLEVRTWGDHSVSSCRPYSRAEGPGTSAGLFPMALSLSGEDPRGPRRGAKGSLELAALRRPPMPARARRAPVYRRAFAGASKLLGWLKRCKLAHAFLCEYSYKRLRLAQLLGQLGIFLTLRPRGPYSRLPHEPDG